MSAAAPARIPRKRRDRGFTPLPNQHLDDLIRATASSHALLSIALMIVQETLGAARAPATPPPEYSRPITIDEFAARIGSDSRTVEWAIAASLDRDGSPGLFRRRRAGRGWCYAVCFDNLRRFRRKPEKQPEEEVQEAQDDAAEGEQKDKRNVLRPLRLRKGCSKRLQLPVAVQSVRVEATADVDVEPSIEDGLLSLRIGSPPPAAIDPPAEAAPPVAGDPPGNPRAGSSEQPAGRGLSSELRAAVTPLFLPLFGHVPDAGLLQKIAHELADVPIAYYVRIVRQRLVKADARRVQTGLFVLLAGDARRGWRDSDPAVLNRGTP